MLRERLRSRACALAQLPPGGQLLQTLFGRQADPRRAHGLGARLAERRLYSVAVLH